MSRVRLFCLPYAGGSAMVYTRWKEHLHQGIELCPIELPGRGTRIHSACLDTFDALVEDVYASIRERLDDRPYAIYGHSMGSWLAFEVAHKIKHLPHRQPSHLFFSARRAPQVQKQDVAYHQLSFKDLQQELIKLGGTSQELFENKELTKTFLPILLTDFQVIHNYQYTPRADKLACSISALSGKGDVVITGSDLTAWKEHSSVGCRIYKLDGGHFFINENMVAVVEIVNASLSDLAAQG